MTMTMRFGWIGCFDININNFQFPGSSFIPTPLKILRILSQPSMLGTMMIMNVSSVS